MQTWPVRSPRPVASKLAADTPLLTGQVIKIQIKYISVFSSMVAVILEVCVPDFCFVSACP